jgi:hypothetical protein
VISDNSALVIPEEAPSDDVEDTNFLLSHIRTSESPTTMSLSLAASSDNMNSKYSPSASNVVGQSLSDSATQSVEQENFAWTVRGDMDNIHVERINHGAYSEIHKVCISISKLIFLVAE